MISQDLSSRIWRIKALAIFTVLFAHFPPEYNILVGAFNNLGMWGVPSFMILAGYFDFKSHFSYLKNIKGLLIPLCIWGTLTFFLANFKAPENLSLIEWIRWLIGAGTWLYFVPVLFLCKILYRLPYSQYYLPILGFTSIVLTEIHLFPYSVNFTPYMNPFNFILYFALGRWLRCKFDDQDIECNYKYLLFAIIFLILIAPYADNYFCISGVITGILACYILFCLASICHANLLVKIGKVSFVIYFLHMHIGESISRKCTLVINTPFEWIKILIAFVIVYLIVELIQKILLKYNCNKLISWLGYRS